MSDRNNGNKLPRAPLQYSVPGVPGQPAHAAPDVLPFRTRISRAPLIASNTPPLTRHSSSIYASAREEPNSSSPKRPRVTSQDEGIGDGVVVQTPSTQKTIIQTPSATHPEPRQEHPSHLIQPIQDHYCTTAYWNHPPSTSPGPGYQWVAVPTGPTLPQQQQQQQQHAEGEQVLGLPPPSTAAPSPPGPSYYYTPYPSHWAPPPHTVVSTPSMQSNTAYGTPPGHPLPAHFTGPLPPPTDQHRQYQQDGHHTHMIVDQQSASPHPQPSPWQHVYSHQQLQQGNNTGLTTTSTIPLQQHVTHPVPSPSGSHFYSRPPQFHHPPPLSQQPPANYASVHVVPPFYQTVSDRIGTNIAVHSPAPVTVQSRPQEFGPATAPPVRSAQRPGVGNNNNNAGNNSGKLKAIAINKRITQATTAKEILDVVQYELDDFDPIALATAVHRLASLRGAPNLHETITQSPEFFKLLHAIQTRHKEHNIRNIANILWAMAKMNYVPSPAVMQALCDSIPSKVEQGVAQNVANTLWALSTLSYKPRDEVLDALAAAVYSKISDFTSQHISNSVIAFAKLEYAIEPKVLDALGHAALSKLPTFTAQALSNTIWGLSKLGIADGDLFRAVAHGSRANLPNFNSQNLSNTIYAYGNLGIHPGQDFIREFSAVTIDKMAEFTPQNLSNVAWAYAKIGEWDALLFTQISRRALQTMHTFTPQSSANILWAYATLGQAPDPVFFRAVVKHSVNRLDEWAPQNLSNVAWALAVLKDEETAQEMASLFLSAIAANIQKRLVNPELEKHFSRQHLVNYLWALANIEYNPGEAALRAITNSLKSRVSLCNAQELANAVWAAGKLKAYDEEFLNMFAEESIARIDELTEQNVVMLIVGCAKLQYYHDDLFRLVAGLDMIKTITNETHLGVLLHSYAVLNAPFPKLFSTLVDRIYALFASDIQPMSFLAKALWSCSIANVMDRALWDAFMKQILVHHRDLTSQEPITQESYNQMCQAHMLACARHPKVAENESWWSINDEQLEQQMYSSWKQQVSEIRISSFHTEVSRILNKLGEKHRVECLTEDGLFSIDCALPDEKIAVEVDGPHHFIRNTLTPMADMLARTDLLEVRGWKVVSVPYFAWEGLEEPDQRALLVKLLNEARYRHTSEDNERVQCEKLGNSRVMNDEADTGGATAIAVPIASFIPMHQHG